jgi:hypothetical protein
MWDQLKVVSPMSGWAMLAIVVVLLLSFEVGRWLGRRRQAVQADRKLHAANVLSGMLTLMAFLLALSFGIAEGHFSDRRQIVLDEANAIGTTFLRAEYLPTPESGQAQQLLREYVDQRIQENNLEGAQKARARSETLQQELWQVAVALEERNPNSEFAGLFVVSLNEMIDLHQSRVTAVFEYRLPLSIMVVLYVVAILTMLVMGYGAGMGGSGDALLTVSLVLAIAAALALIIDLDRPFQRTFGVSQQALIDVRETLQTDAPE